MAGRLAGPSSTSGTNWTCLELISGLNRDRGVIIVMVLHDLNHAARFSDRMIAMSSGDVVADGSPAEVLTSRLLRDCFGVAASVVTDPVTGSPMCIPHSSALSDDEENAAQQ